MVLYIVQYHHQSTIIKILAMVLKYGNIEQIPGCTIDPKLTNKKMHHWQTPTVLLFYVGGRRTGMKVYWFKLLMIVLLLLWGKNSGSTHIWDEVCTRTLCWQTGGKWTRWIRHFCKWVFLVSNVLVAFCVSQSVHDSMMYFSGIPRVFNSTDVSCTSVSR